VPEQVRHDEAGEHDAAPDRLPSQRLTGPAAREPSEHDEHDPAERPHAGGDGHAEAGRKAGGCTHQSTHRD
jgi:hypothetical protein